MAHFTYRGTPACMESKRYLLLLGWDGVCAPTSPPASQPLPVPQRRYAWPDWPHCKGGIYTGDIMPVQLPTPPKEEGAGQLLELTPPPQP